MRTAYEIEQYCYGRTPMQRGKIIQKALDEAVAHGMTIAADITQQAQHQDEDAWTISDPIRGDILIARDNKIWRKE